MISPANTWPGLTKPGIGEANEPEVYRPSHRVTYFRVVPADDIQGEVGARWAKELGATKVFVLHDRELYGQGLAKMFKLNAGKLGLTLVGFEGIDPQAANYKSLVTKIRQSGAELVYFGGTTQTNAGQIAKDLVSGGLEVKLMVPTAASRMPSSMLPGPPTSKGGSSSPSAGCRPISRSDPARPSSRPIARASRPSRKATRSTPMNAPRSPSMRSGAPGARIAMRSAPPCARPRTSPARWALVVRCQWRYHPHGDERQHRARPASSPSSSCSANDRR
jgi:hypothetical protein